MPLENRYTALKMSRGWGMVTLLLLILVSAGTSASMAFHASGGAIGTLLILLYAAIASGLCRLIWGGVSVPGACFALSVLGGFTGWGIASLTGGTGLGTTVLAIAVGAISPIVYFLCVSLIAKRKK